MSSFPKGWELLRWGDIATLEYGRALTGYRNRTDGPIRVYGTNGPVGWHDIALGEGPGVIVGRKGAYRGVHYEPGPFWVIDTAFYLRPTRPLDMRWAYYALKTHDINKMDSGSAIPSTSRDAFYSLRVVVPPIDDQRAIASTLGAFDDKIASNEEIIRRSEEAIKALYELGSKRSVPLSSIATPERHLVNPEAFADELVDLLSIPAYDSGQWPQTVPASSIRSHKLTVGPERVLLSRLNPRIPRVWAPAVRDRPALCSTEFLVLVPLEGVSRTDLWAACWSRTAHDEMVMRATGTSGSHQRVTVRDTLSVSVNDPHDVPYEAKVLSQSLLDRTQQARQQNRALETTRDALLPELIEGRLEVHVGQES